MKFMLYYIITLNGVLNKKGVRMEFVYVGIGIVIGVVGALVLDVDSLSNLWAKKEETLDEKNEENEEVK